VLGLQYIHDNGQIHRDIKGQNILLDGSGSVKLADFGVSGWLIPQNEKAKTFVGTPCWMAPGMTYPADMVEFVVISPFSLPSVAEVMEQVHGYDYKADLWSLGITALELAKGYAPYARYPPMKVLILTIQEEPPSLETYDYAEQDDDDAVTQEWSKEFRQIISWLLQKDTTKRPTCQQLLQSPLLRTRDDSRQSLQEEICNKVPDVGAPSGDEKITLPGLAPVSILTTTAEDRPAGTTWVFADGSQVLASDAKERELDDVLQELDAFSGETGGENYKKEECQQQEEGETDKKNESDDLDDFLDEFEKTTAGENFQR
jgi:serine/threonine-protein kinase OSR1/STK39